MNISKSDSMKRYWQQYNNDFELEIFHNIHKFKTKSALADYFGITKATLYKHLHNLQNKGMLNEDFEPARPKGLKEPVSFDFL